MGDEVDRISKLPNAIIQHILSFLSTEDVVQTCLLSKRWKLMWYSVPTLSFSNKTTRFRLPEGLQKFCNYVDHCLEHRKRGMYFIVYDSAITSFKIWMNSYERSQASRIDKWVAFAVKHKVKEINLRVGKERDERGDIHRYSLPKTLAVNARCLTILKLNTVQLDSGCSFSFPSLKSLSLSLVRIEGDDVIDKLLLGSPCLERLRLVYCYLSSDYQLQLHSSSLKFLEITLTESTYIVKRIGAINLESFELCGVPFDKIDISECKAIKSLSLACDWGMEESPPLEYLISSLPLLEDLTLTNEYGLSLKRIKISSQHLKSFKLNNCIFNDKVSVIIESAPKLESFYYRGDINFAISMDSSSNLLNGTFKIFNWLVNYDEIWFIKMINFLLNLNCSWSVISLQVNSENALILPEDLKRICRSPLVNWEHLRVLTTCKPERESDLRESLQWISPSLKTLSIAKGTCF
ncbi:F-box/FBD/LRR-repeat protein At1g16930-like [Humulus lupulus]|uniref:F-box/FBD/LRR-repeat protein At1g16930-like n=1 Tax=Humulus lupulus TaxID=3486 RepID=UPI002B40C05A|nr:F-box/FBD/LRR-repeat protein At1g16930-like [Humulus lupulus]